MSDFNNINDNPIRYDSTESMLVDEVSSTEFYIGTTNKNKDTSAEVWRIKKIWKDGNVWNFGFPNGDQSYTFIWSARDTLTYQ